MGHEKAYLWSGLAMLGGMENAQSIKMPLLHLSDEQEAAILEQAKRCLRRLRGRNHFFQISAGFKTRRRNHRTVY